MKQIKNARNKTRKTGRGSITKIEAIKNAQKKTDKMMINVRIGPDFK